MLMIKDMAVLMMLGTMATQLPVTAQQSYPAEAPKTLSEYVEAAQSGDIKPDAFASTIASLCPVISEAAESAGEEGKPLMAACTMLQSTQVNTDNLLAMVD